MEKSTKSEIIRDSIYQSLVDGTYNANCKIPSENEFCRRFNTSRFTVRKAIDELVLDGKLYRIQGVGTFVQGDRNIHVANYRIVLVMPTYESLYNTGVVGGLTKGIKNFLDKNDCSFVTVLEPRNEDDVQRFIENVVEAHADGIIYSFCFGRGIIDILKRIGLPVVVVDTEPENNPFDFIAGEDFDSAYRVTCLAYAQGLKRIGFYTEWDQKFSTMRIRSEGLIQALDDLGVEYNPEWIHFGSDDDIEYHAEIVMRDKLSDAREYLKKNRDLEMIIAGNDEAAFMLRKTAVELGIRFPEDIKVVSYGNYKWNDYFDFGFTSFEQNFYQYGKAAAELLLQRMNGELENTKQIRKMKYKLIRRSSF